MTGGRQLAVAVAGDQPLHEHVVQSYLGDLDVAGAHEELGRVIERVVACHLEAQHVAVLLHAEWVRESEVAAGSAAAW